MTEPSREAIAGAIKAFCLTFGKAAVQKSWCDGVERIYYAGIPVDGLADSILARLSAQPAGNDRGVRDKLKELLRLFREDYLSSDETIDGFFQDTQAREAGEPATAMTAQGALEIAANIAESIDSGRGNEKIIAHAIRDVAKRGYWNGTLKPQDGGK
jgi:hypothetical protein